MLEMSSKILSLIFILSLFIFSACTKSGWIVLVVNPDDRTVYFDNSMMSRDGDLAKIWILSDYTKIKVDNDYRYLSSKEQYEFDCKRNMNRRLSIVMFSGKMGAGESSIYNSTSSWMPVIPGSYGQDEYNVACKK